MEQVPLAQELLAWLANPNVAYVLLVLGMIGLLSEIAVPGITFAGISGVICLILSLVGLGQLPTNWAGVALIVAGLVMLVLDLHVTGFALTVGGIIAFGLGSLLIFGPTWIPTPATDERLSPIVVLVATGAVAAFFVVGLSKGIKAQTAPIAVGRETLIGQEGVVQRALAPQGIVRLAGEEWTAEGTAGVEIGEGTRVKVVGLNGLKLLVEPLRAPDEVGTDSST